MKWFGTSWEHGLEHCCQNLMRQRDEMRRAVPIPSTVRPELNWFAQAMEAQLRQNDHKGGAESWRNDSPLDLIRRIHEELEELERIGPGHMVAASLRVIENPGNPGHRAGCAHDILSEAADVANFCMMVADVCARGMTVKR